MTKLAPFIIFFFFFSSIKAQTDSASINRDKMFLDTSFLKLIAEMIKPTSSLNISLGIGNKLFSAKNNSFNANQAEVKKIYFTPSITYLYKNGLGLSVTPYISSDSGKSSIYQTAISPSYFYSNKNISSGISYTRYLSDNSIYNGNSIYQNELFGNLTFNNKVISTTIVIGYSKGTFREINLDTIRFNGQVRPIRDSTTNKIKSFSLSAGIFHNFRIEKIFGKNDDIVFTPQLLLQAGSEKFSSTHINKAYERFVARSRRINSTTTSTNAGFSLQSLALALDGTYSVGKFYFNPNVYFDYYLPSTSSKRLTSIYSLSLGVTL